MMQILNNPICFYNKRTIFFWLLQKLGNYTYCLFFALDCML